MISRAHRFHGHTSLSHVYRRGTTLRAGGLALRYVRNDRRTTYRVAVIVSKKVHKAAVDRNRMRRRLYEIVRLQDSAITGPYDLLLTVFSEQLVDMPPADLSHLVHGLLCRGGIIGAPAPASPKRAIVKT